MSAQPMGALAVLDELALRREPFGSTEEAVRQYEGARAALSELITAASEFSRGMPLQFADNARVVGNCNARQIENMRAALARVSGGAA